VNDYELEEKKFFEDVSFQRLDVLIWGPGDPEENDDDAEAKKAYEKRCLMRATLREKYPRARVRFSEEIKKRNPEMSQLDQETFDAKFADLVIILDIGRGADLELDHFTKFSWFRTKVYLFVPQKYLDAPGLADEVYKLIPEKQRKGYSPEEYERCDVAKVRTLDIMEIVAGLKGLSY